MTTAWRSTDSNLSVSYLTGSTALSAWSTVQTATPANMALLLLSEYHPGTSDMLRDSRYSTDVPWISQRLTPSENIESE